MDPETTVVAFEIPTIDESKCTNVRSFKVKELLEKKQQVEKAKGLYDKPNNQDNKRFYYIIRQFEHASNFRQEVHEKYNTPNVSNAWLKAYELFIHYKVFPRDPVESFRYFDNAAFPGSFILAAWHLVNTFCNIKDFQWYGSSLLTPEDLGNKGPLQDKYKLYENYPDNWLMNADNNGDVTSCENQNMFEKALGGSIDLYTSDLGFDVSDDYNNQEMLQAHANLGQIVTALMVLKKGGIMITKQYSYFDPFTISLIGVLTRVFDKVEVCKPMFSKSGNSEIYLVGIGYNTNTRNITDLLLNRLKNWSTKPLITKGCLGNRFLSIIIESQTYFADVQIKRLVDTISEYNRFIKSRNTDRKHISETNKFNAENIRDLKKWTAMNPLKPLPDNKQLKLVEVLAWKPRGGNYRKK